MATEDYVVATGGGALAGAGAGAGVGAAVGGPVGAGIGAGIGAVAGGIFGLMGQSQAEKQEAEQRRLARKQRRREKNLRAKQRSVEKRSLAQQRSGSARSAKDDSTIPAPRVSTSDVALQQSMAVGTGSPFDTYIIQTYGQPQSTTG